MSEFVNKLKEIKQEAVRSTDSATNRCVSVELIEALIEGTQQLINRVDTLEQNLEEHKKGHHKSRRL